MLVTHSAGQFEKPLRFALLAIIVHNTRDSTNQHITPMHEVFACSFLVFAFRVFAYVRFSSSSAARTQQCAVRILVILGSERALIALAAVAFLLFFLFRSSRFVLRLCARDTHTVLCTICAVYTLCCVHYMRSVFGMHDGSLSRFLCAHPLLLRSAPCALFAFCSVQIVTRSESL